MITYIKAAKETKAAIPTRRTAQNRRKKYDSCVHVTEFECLVSRDSRDEIVELHLMSL